MELFLKLSNEKTARFGAQQNIQVKIVTIRKQERNNSNLQSLKRKKQGLSVYPLLSNTIHLEPISGKWELGKICSTVCFDLALENRRCVTSMKPKISSGNAVCLNCPVQVNASNNNNDLLLKKNSICGVLCVQKTIFIYRNSKKKLIYCPLFWYVSYSDS